MQLHRAPRHWSRSVAPSQSHFQNWTKAAWVCGCVRVRVHSSDSFAPAPFWRRQRIRHQPSAPARQRPRRVHLVWLASAKMIAESGGRADHRRGSNIRSLEKSTITGQVASPLTLSLSFSLAQRRGEGPLVVGWIGRRPRRPIGPSPDPLSGALELWRRPSSLPSSVLTRSLKDSHGPRLS